MVVGLKVVAIAASACISILHGGELPDVQTRRWPWNHNIDDINCEEEIPLVSKSAGLFVLDSNSSILIM